MQFFAPDVYRNVLGKAGLRRYRELAEAAWGKLKPATADTAYDSRRSALTRLMETLAEMSGNVEELVAVKRPLRLALAGQLETSRPEDAIVIYRSVVPDIVTEAKNSSYEEGMKYVRRIGELMKKLGQSRPYADYLAELHVAFKPKRNFIKLLEAEVRRLAAPK